MNHADLHAIRTAAALRSAQRAYENRAEPEGVSTDTVRDYICRAEELIGRAERALTAGNVEAACDLLGCAGAELVEIAEAAQ